MRVTENGNLDTELKKVWISRDGGNAPYCNRVDVWDAEPSWFLDHRAWVGNTYAGIPLASSWYNRSEPVINWFQENLGFPEPGQIWEVTLK